MKPGKLILTSALACFIFASCNNANNNNNNNNDAMDNNANTSTIDTTAVNNTNSNANLNNNNNNMSNGTVSADAADFMRKAASGGMLEVAVGRLAQTNSSSADVKAMGKMLITDHTEGNNKLKAIATQKGVTLPDTMMDKQQDLYNKLADLKGKDFDEKFSSMAVDDHKDDIDEFTSNSKTIKDTDLLNWIKNTLPVLQKHLTHAKALDKKYNK